MQTFFVALFLFLFVFFSYIHVTAQWKTSDDLELYESDYVSPSQVQDIVAVKQPVLFYLLQPTGSNPVGPKGSKGARDFCAKFQLRAMEKYDNVDVRVKSVLDYFSSDSVEWVHLPLRSAQQLLASDTNAKYVSETNHEFMEETGLKGLAAYHLDPMWRPPLAVLSKYDLIFGSPQTTTPLRYHTNHQLFLLVCSGKVRVKMCPPKYRKVLDVVEDYDYYEFWSPLRIWSQDPHTLDKRDKEILDRIKFLEFEVTEGHVLFVPKYWWYSLRFSGDTNTTICSAAYDTPASIASNTKPLAIHFMQRTQTKTVVTPVKQNSSIETTSEPTEPIVTPGFKTGFEMDTVETINKQAETKPMQSAPLSEKKLPTEIVTNSGVYHMD